MRKVLYGCAALAVVGAAGIYLVTDQAARHPNSLVGRCMTAMLNAGVTLNPFTVLERTTQVPGAPVACEQMPQDGIVGQVARVPKPEAGVEPAGEAGVEPAPEAEEPAEPQEVIQVEARPEQGPAAGFVGGELAEPCDEGRGHGVAGETGEPLPVGEPAEECEPAPTAPARMPYADETEPAPAPAAGGCAVGTCGWLWELIKQLGISPPKPAQDTAAPTPEAQGQESNDSATQPEGSEQSAAPAQQCPEPEQACPYPHGEYTPPATDDPSAPAQKHVRRVHRTMRVPLGKPFGPAPGAGASGVFPGPTGLDTMEYRPTDGDEDAYDGIQF